jgi:enoyl-[acyl-carrier-protein] reductase (NADH)
LNEKARRFVEPLARELEASITGEVDVSVPGQLEAIFEQIYTRWGRLDILVHSIAFAPKADLQGGLLNCSAEGFAKAMDVSCHSRQDGCCGAVDDKWRRDVRRAISAQTGGCELQRDGPSEGG